MSSRYIAQVNNIGEDSVVAVAFIRELVGVALVDGRKAAFSTSGSYANGGAEFADRARVALFRAAAASGGQYGSALEGGCMVGLVEHRGQRGVRVTVSLLLDLVEGSGDGAGCPRRSLRCRCARR